jgi:hypothetical protein
MSYPLVFNVPVELCLKFMAPIGSDSVDAKRELLNHIINEVYSIFLIMTPVDFKRPYPGSVINVKRRDILRTDRRIHLRVGADEAITIDDQSIPTIQGVTVTKKYIHTMQKVASSPLMFTQNRRSDGCHDLGLRLMMLILS